jgi:hypothetical protein
MEPSLKKILRSLSLELRHILEGYYDNKGDFHPGDLETRLNELGVWLDRPAKSLEELPHLSQEDQDARQVIDAYIEYRAETAVARSDAVAEFVRESAYTWANRLFTLRCMEARAIIDEVILQKDVYGGRSLKHNRLARSDPQACAGPDEGLFAVLFAEFEERARELPELFNPKAPAIALRPSNQALKRCIALLSGRETVISSDPASDEVFSAPDALGWAYQYWNTEEKDRVFENVRTKKAKIEGADIIPATQLYTEPYMVKFLVQNSLGALWMGMHPDSKLADGWKFYVKDADRAPVEPRSVSEITFLDPAAGSGHFLLEAFHLFFQMYREEVELQQIKEIPTAEEIAASILNNNLFAIDIDGRAIQIAIAALWMKAKEYAPDLEYNALYIFHEHMVATNIHLPKGKDHLKTFLEKHPEARPLQLALETIFEGLQNVHELGSLVQIEEPVEKELRYLKEQFDAARGKPKQMVLFDEMNKPRQGELPLGLESYEQWKAHTLADLEQHFTEEAETADRARAFFGQSAYKGLALFELLARRYDIVAANPPWMGSRNMGAVLKPYVFKHYAQAKDDLFAAFIIRNCGLSASGGYVAMLTQQSWLFLRSYTELRSIEENGSFRGVLHQFRIECLASLGRYAFSELGNAVIHPSLFVLRKIGCSPVHRIYAIRLDRPRLSEEQAMLLKQGANLRASNENVVFVQQSTFLRIPDTPLAYWLPQEIVQLFQGPTVKDICILANRTKTGENERFVRFVWELNSRIGQGCDWLIYQKGGEYKTYFGVNIRAVKWNDAYVNYYRKNPDCRVTDREYTCREVLTYNGIGDQFCGRIAPPISTYDVQGPALLGSREDLLLALAVLNSRFGSYIIKSLNGSLSMQSSDVLSVPVPTDKSKIRQITALAQQALNIREQLCSSDIVEYSFRKVLSVETKLELEEHFITTKNCISELVNDSLGIAEQQVIFRLPHETSFELIEFEKQADLKAILITDYLEDIFTVLVLRLLGHRWPKQIDSCETVPEWADADGIIPLTTAFGEQTLLERVRIRFPHEFPGGLVASIEREFEGVVREPLEKWLSGSFYKRHISQFKKRPVVWQLQSRPANRRSEPAFSCLIYYHKLDIDLLPKLRSQYVGPLRQRYETELRTLSNLALLTADQSERRLQLEVWIDELIGFEARLEQVENEGFASPTLAKIAKKEPLDRWTSRDGQAPHPQDPHAFELQEKRYDPDLNDGVRVNIAPLQKAGLLAADVLNAKDVDKAIADRAEWRADERRWCREGKLPQPGWWE